MNINEMKQLNNEQYDAARSAAVIRVNARIGNRPTRAAFKRELGNVWTILDILALIVFAAALAVSSVHIIKHMGGLAAASYDALTVNSQDGIAVNRNTYAIVHQVAMIALAEASMLLFMVIHNMSAPSRAARPLWTRPLSVPLGLAFVSGLFVFVANWQSQIGVLESLIPPLVTVGLGLHLEKLITLTLARRDDVNARYLSALAVYEKATEDPTKHPDYLPMLRQEVWQKLSSLKPNRDYVEAPAAVRHAAVAREMMRDTWAYQEAPAADPDTKRASNNGNGNHNKDEDFLAMEEYRRNDSAG